MLLDTHMVLWRLTDDPMPSGTSRAQSWPSPRGTVKARNRRLFPLSAGKCALDH
jgi:hypothetical protein